MPKSSARALIILLGAFTSTPGMGVEQKSQAELEAWLNDDNEATLEILNGDKPVFLDENQTEIILHSKNLVIISMKSIDTGWVTIEQCHNHLDEIMKTQIEYQYKSMRNLRILSTSNIENAWIEENSVVLNNTQNDASICISVNAKIFYQEPDKTYTLVSGPYHRKVMDSYLPIHVSYAVKYPAEYLQYTGIHPEPRDKFKILLQPGKVAVDAYLTGKLTIEIQFKEITPIIK